MSTVDPHEAYQLTFETRDNYLYAYVEGEEDSYEISAAYWREVGAKLHELGIHKVLIVEDLKGASPLADVYNVSAQIVDMGFRGKIVAFVDRQSSHKDLNEFGELVGTNRGLIGKTFLDEGEAESWLLKQ